MDLSALGKEPVSEQKPAGENVSYDPEFEELEAEIGKLSSPTASDQTNWKKVAELSVKILSEKSKDLRVASHLAVARLQGDKIEGFAEGTRLFADLIENFWDKLYPPKKRMRGRVGAIQWWLEKVDGAFFEFEPEPMPQKAIEDLKGELKRLEELLAANLEEPPMLRGLARFLESIPAIVEKVEEEKPETETLETPAGQQQPDSETQAAAPAPRPAPTQAAGADTDEIATEKDARKVLRFGQDKLRQVAAYFRENNLMEPLGYRCTRIAAWTAVGTIPPAQDGQKTSLPPPDPQFISTVNQLREKGNFEAMIPTVEARLSQYLFWLDLNRFTADALSSMGDRYRDAYDAVCRETAFFVLRMKGLEDLMFQDGTPFADADTIRWLNSIRPGSGSGMSDSMASGDGSGGGGENEKMAETIRKAGTLAGKKQFIEAVEILQQELANSPSGKEAMLWRFALARILIDSRKTRLVVPHLEQILSDIDKFHLEMWDPALALNGLRVVLTGFTALSDKAFEHRVDETLDRIAKLNPAEALRVYKG